MRVDVKGIGIKVSSQLEDKIQAKLKKFDRYFGDGALSTVKMKAEHDEVQLELTLRLGGRNIARAEAASSDVMLALEKAIDVLEGQLRKHKTKLKRRKHEAVVWEPYFEAAPIPDEEPELRVVKEKSFPIEPMDLEEAITEMNLLNHSFHLFLNQETGKVNLVYRRKDGDFGLIIPEY